MNKICLLTMLVMLPPTLLFAETTSKNPGTGTHQQFLTGFDGPNYPELLDQLRGYRQRLMEQRRATKLYLSKHAMNSRDVVITVVMPGGLLYAANRKRQINNAKAKIYRLNKRIAEVNQDIEHFSAMMERQLAFRP